MPNGKGAGKGAGNGKGALTGKGERTGQGNREVVGQRAEQSPARPDQSSRRKTWVNVSELNKIFEEHEASGTPARPVADAEKAGNYVHQTIQRTTDALMQSGKITECTRSSMLYY